MATKQEIFESTLTSKYETRKFVDFIREMITGVRILAPDKENKPYNTFSVFVKQYSHVGEYDDEEGNSIGIFAIELNRGESIERARTAQRSFVKTLLEKGGYSGALVAFYSEGLSVTWRFSFIRMDYEFAKGKIKESLTPAKRYSYLVGQGEPCHTAMARLLPIFTNDDNAPTLDELEDAFSVETVTKEFFEKYKEKYFEMQEFLEENKDFAEESKRRGFTSEQFTKKLLSQIVFLYFVQKKGWLGVNAIPRVLMESEYKKAFFARGSKSRDLVGKLYVQNENGFYELDMKQFRSLTVEEEEFFSSFIQGRPWGTGPKDFMRRIYDDCVKRDKNFFDDYLEPLFYTGLNKNRGENAFFAPLHCRIPFLNGGLFEELDNYDWQNNDFAIPNEMFSNKDTKGRDADGILDIFDRYNFTMAEDEPMEREVAVDPEMLGKVFENLLDVTDRKSKGSFYTPREIVHYMSQESLINYLVTRTGIPEDDIRKLILYGEYFKDKDAEKTKKVPNKNGNGYHMELDKEKEFEIPASIFSYKDNVNRLQELDDLLANIKVVDPAVGSGAFPLGMLNEIVKARDTLTTYLTIEMHSYDKKVLFASGYIGSRNIYDLKSETIKNCIFACDVEPSATDIAKLRLWLSLVIEDELSDEKQDGGLMGQHSKPKQLPNLDCNIICGNSLVDRFGGIDLISSSEVLKNINGEHQENAMQAGIDKMIETLISLQDKLFYTKEHEEKVEIKSKIQAIYDAIIEKQLAVNPELLQKYRESLIETSRPFVLWQLYFPKVFKETGGFDICIGNPPYLESRSPEFSDEMKDVLQSIVKRNYGKNANWFPRGCDLLIYFFELSFKLLKDDGINAFITQNSWLDTEFGKKFQQFLLHETSPLAIVDSDYKYFETANINTVITFIKKGIGKTDRICFARCHNKNNLMPISDSNNTIEIDASYKFVKIEESILNDLKWGIIFNTEKPLMDIISQTSIKGKRIDDIENFAIGQGLNLKKTYIVDEENIQKHCLPKDSTIPFFVTEESGIYYWEKSGHFLIDKKKAGNFNSKDFDLFDSSKTTKVPPVLILPRGIGARHFCCYNELGGYSASCVDVYCENGIEASDDVLRLWLYMNSTLFWLIREIAGRKNLGGGMLKAEAVDLEQFALLFDFSEMDKIRAIFNKCKCQTIDNAIDEIKKDIHKEIDNIVFDYFGFNLNQRKYIIDSFNSKIIARYKKSNS